MKKLLLILIGVLLSLPALAADGDNFSYTYQGQTLTYTILSETDKTVQTREGKNYSPGNEVSGDLILPEKVIYNDVEYTLIAIGSYAFFQCNFLTGVEIPNSVTEIGEAAFQACTGLTGVTIGNSVIEIGSFAFAYCEGLTGVTIGNSVTEIGSYAFAGCTGLTDLTIGNSVISIGSYAFSSCTGLTDVTIPTSVTSIGWQAFSYCEGLTSVEIPNSVISIGHEAFIYCKSLKSVVIGNSVTSIGIDAFYGCNRLIKNAYPDTIESPFRSGIDIKYPADNSEIEDGIVYGKDKSAIWFVPYDIEDGFEIPNSVTSIGEYAFYECTDLKSVIIPTSVTEIEDSAFEGCTGLKKNACPNTIKNPFKNGTTITYQADNSEFEDGIIYSKDKSAIWFVPYDIEDGFEIPNSVTLIGTYAISWCNGLTNFVIPNSVKTIGFGSFAYCFSLTNIEIPNSVTSIGDYAFFDCRGLNSIEIPNSVTKIGTQCFAYCTSLKDVNVNWENPVTINSDTFPSATYNNAILNIPENTWEAYVYSNWNNFDNIYSNGNIIGKITDDFFTYRYSSADGEAVLIQNEDYMSLTTVTIPDRVVADGSFYKVTGIGNNAFYRCGRIKSLILPQNLVRIGNSAFYNCTGLTGIEIPNSVISIGEEAFQYCTSLTDVAIGNSVTEIGESAFWGCDSLTKVNITDLAKWCEIKFEDWLSTPLFYAHNLYINDELITDLVIPSTVTYINFAAFYQCTGLKSVVIPNSVTSLGSQVFSGCTGLTGIEIPNSVTEIGSSSFYGCTSLTSVTIGNSVTEIGVYAFYGCSNLNNVTLNNSLKEIKNNTFANTAISSINLPPSLERLDGSAFNNCGKLNTVTISQSDEPLNIVGNLFEGLSVKTLNLERNLSLDEGAGLKTTTLEQVNFGGSVSSINDGLFSNNANIKTVVIPSSVEYIGESAFENTGLTSIAIGAGIQEIGDKAFAGCSPSTIAITATTSPKAVNTTFSYIAGKLYVTPGYEDEYYDNPNCWYRFSYPTALVEATDLKVTSKKDAAGNIKLNGTVEPSGASLPYVIWKSEDTSLASVDPDGTVHFYGDASSCGITATTLYADGPTVSLVLNSDGTIQGEEIEAESITLDVTKAELTVGKSLELKATVLPEDTTDKTLTWSSSNVNVATVSATGLVTAIAAGTATISVTCGEVSANCEITVVNPIVDADQIVLNIESAELNIGETVQLEATVLPEDTTDKTLTWSSSNENVATVSEEGVVTAIAEGNAVITVSCGGVSAECEVTVTEEAGIESLLANPDSKISVYSTGGFLIKKDCKVEDLKLLDKGIYIIVSGKERYKISI